MLPSLTSTVVAVKPRIDATLRWIYQKTFSAKDRIAFYDMLAFLLDNNKSLQQAFIDSSHAIRKNDSRKQGALLNRESVKKRINYVYPVNKRVS